VGVSATGTLGGGSQVERQRRKNRGAVGGEGGRGRGCAPSQKIYEFFISKWCDMKVARKQVVTRRALSRRHRRRRRKKFRLAAAAEKKFG